MSTSPLFAAMVVAASGAYSYDSYGACVYPEICQPPSHNFSRVLPVKGRFQWDESGGFCGSMSIQTMALTYGAWISQDNVRKANRGGLCFGHTDKDGGCEVGPENYGLTARNLKLNFDEWDFTQLAPQAPAFKKWIKSHLVKGEPVMWAPILKNHEHTLYGRVSVPGNGHFDHHEPIIGVGSKHNLADPEVYDDDWLVHYSGYHVQPCFRNFSSLEDNAEMQGNCKDVRAGKFVMFPCFYEQVTYGLAIKGLNMFGRGPRVHLDMDRPDEPRVRLGHAQAMMHGHVTVTELQPGRKYVLYRFNSTEALPDGVALDLLDMSYERRYPFEATGETWSFKDPQPIMSDSSTYYVAIAADAWDIEVADSLKQRVPKAFLDEAKAFGVDTPNLHKDVRPLGDPELTLAPLFKSLAELPSSNFWAGCCLVALAGMATMATMATMAASVWQARRRSEPTLEIPALG